MFFSTACNKTSDGPYQVFFYLDYSLNPQNYKVEIIDQSTSIPYTVGTFTQDCNAFAGTTGCGQCKHKDANPNAELEEGDYTVELIQISTGDVLDTHELTVTKRDLGDCEGIELVP